MSIILAVGRIRIIGKPTYEDLERRIKQLDLEILEYQRKDKVLNEDLIGEIKRRKRLEKELKQVSHGLGERIKELNCLYSISKLRERTDFSLEDILQPSLISFLLFGNIRKLRVLELSLMATNLQPIIIKTPDGS